VAGAEDEFEVRVILREKAFQVALELGFESVDGLEKGDWWREAQRLFSAGKEAKDGVKGEDEESGGAKQAEEAGVEEDVGEDVQIEIVAEGIGMGDRS